VKRNIFANGSRQENRNDARRANQLAIRSPGDPMKHRAVCNKKAARSRPGRGAASFTLLRRAGTHVELSALCNLSQYSKMADHDPPYRPASCPPYELFRHCHCRRNLRSSSNYFLENEKYQRRCHGSPVASRHAALVAVAGFLLGLVAQPLILKASCATSLT